MHKFHQVSHSHSVFLKPWFYKAAADYLSRLSNWSLKLSMTWNNHGFVSPFDNELVHVLRKTTHFMELLFVGHFHFLHFAICTNLNKHVEQPQRQGQNPKTLHNLAHTATACMILGANDFYLVDTTTTGITNTQWKNLHSQQKASSAGHGDPIDYTQKSRIKTIA